MYQQPESTSSATHVSFRLPRADDCARLHDLVAQCPPLDRNSRYCNLLQVTRFARTSVLAEDGAGNLIGAVTGFRCPDEPACLFVWQVAVTRAARGQGLAPRMIDAVLCRPACSDIRWIETTIAPANTASWATFRRLAEARGAELAICGEFSAAQPRHGAHAGETLVRIGPFGPLRRGGGIVRTPCVHHVATGASP